MIELVNEVSVELVDCLASDDMVALAAWVSNAADEPERLDDRKKVKGLINFLYRHKHMSPFEHGIFVFKVDVPLFVAREFQRHRTFSYNEVSGRYTPMQPRFYAGNVARVQKGKMGDYYFEDGSNSQTATYLQSKRLAVSAAWLEYEERLRVGIAKEQAREDLPLSLMTQFYATANPRNVMQFLTLRTDKHALKEIRDLAIQIEDIFADTMPLTAQAYRKYRKRDQWVAEQPETLWDDTRAIGGTVQPNINVYVQDSDYHKVDELADEVMNKLQQRAFDRRRHI